MQETLYTYDDYLKLDDDNRYEIIGGKLIMVPSPKSKHQIISLELASTLLDYVRKNKLGRVITAPMDVVLSHTEKPQPDILFISKDRLNIITENNIQGTPDLLIEILSPSTAIYDRTEKSKIYYKYGVKEYWIVDPDIKCIEIFVPGEMNWNLFGAFNINDILVSPLLSGLEINMKELFDI
ncbi:protein of unknown function DUF820 [Desulfofarcimen acetoxidans DSM 771]|jgi:Uma2 family endonuclease|uniref:Putative restriction endonuclease domain-containing protein n=1 Tax=Desulfofarcimen acetoxidans (strain ATCC 49208 / DSM 771 / KCTC 5769 / VKM B-1644 / 5575) TaxID=485916 RepID=C8VVB2_DESAS|nr:Uma2 family endonuclease [Desulfofarcimen acetoxidans]ACV60981.1 protein of unknown function DUF820 [Desulfofarcimen acetoxidans DSM 771]